MELDPSHQHWVSKLRLRMPRHIRQDVWEDTPLVECRSWPQPEKWVEAHKAELQRWANEEPHTIEEKMEIVRKDLTLVPAFFNPERYTTIVEGRPVQAQLYKGNFLWAPTFLMCHGVLAKNSEVIERWLSCCQRFRASSCGPQASLTRSAALPEARMRAAAGT